MRITTLATLLASCSILACGEDPYAPDAARAAGRGNPAGSHPAVPHESPAKLPEAHFSGVVRLRGTFASRTDGTVFVSVKPEGLPAPLFTTRYAVVDAIAESGELVIPFELTDANAIGGLVPGPMDIEAYLDPDGIVESKEPETKIRQRFPVQNGASGIELVLEGT
jgi:hypothetical protein